MRRFHYRSHVCSELFDPDIWRQYDCIETESVEVLNSHWASTLAYIGYLRVDNLVPYIFSKAILINTLAHACETFKKSDLEDADIFAIGSDLLPYRCTRCTSRTLHDDGKDVRQF